jgi:hypothetical protein
MQKAYHCPSTGCFCQVFVFKPTSDVCGGSALYLGIDLLLQEIPQLAILGS